MQHMQQMQHQQGHLQHDPTQMHSQQQMLGQQQTMHHQQQQQQQMHPQQMHMQDQSGMVLGPTGIMMDPNQSRMGQMGVTGGVAGQRYGQQNPQMQQMQQPHMRRTGATRIDAHGQVIIETDENLSDKEIYPGQSLSQMGKFLLIFYFSSIFHVLQNINYNYACKDIRAYLLCKLVL